MFRCSDCKKWLVPSKITVSKEYRDNIVQIINVPAKQCPNCGQSFLEDYVHKQIDDFLSFKVHEGVLDYETFEAIEIAFITNMF